MSRSLYPIDKPVFSQISERTFNHANLYLVIISIYLGHDGRHSKVDII